jgi:hypothetical protein
LCVKKRGPFVLNDFLLPAFVELIPENHWQMLVHGQKDTLRGK